MKVTFPASSKIDRRVAAIIALTVVLVAGLGGLVAACGGTETTTTVGSATSTALVVSTTAALTAPPERLSPIQRASETRLLVMAPTTAHPAPTAVRQATRRLGAKAITFRPPIPWSAQHRG